MATTTYGTFVSISENNPQKTEHPSIEKSFIPEENITEKEIIEEQKKFLPKISEKGEFVPSNGLSSIRLDHDRVRGNFERLLQMKEMEEKVRLFNDTIKMIAQHDVAEEVVFYRALRNVGLGHLVDKAITQTIELEKLVYDMDQKYGQKIEDDAAFNWQLTQLKDMFNKHAGDLEENELIPALEAYLSFDEMESMNTWFEKIKVMAPTRPHPSGPHSAAGKLFVGPIVSFIDHFRDLGKKFSHNAM